MSKLCMWPLLVILISSCGKKVDETHKNVNHSEVSDLKITSNTYGQLINAIKDKEALLVKEALRLEADPNQYDENGFRPLAYAIQAGSVEIIELLLSYGAKTTELDIRANTAIHLAIMLKKEKILYYLLRQCPDLTETNSEGMTALEYAISDDYVDGVKILLAFNNIFKFTEIDYVSLETTSLQKSLESKVNKLLRLNKKLTNGENAEQLFFESLENNFLEGIDLIASVKKIHSMSDGQNIIASYINKTKTEVSDENKAFIAGLVDLGLSVDGERNDSLMPLTEAAKLKNYEMITYLLSLGAQINKVSKDGETALYIAAQNADLESVRLLTTLGAFSEYLYRSENKFYKVNICKSLPEYRRGIFRADDEALKEKVELMRTYLKCE